MTGGGAPSQARSICMPILCGYALLKLILFVGALTLFDPRGDKDSLLLRRTGGEQNDTTARPTTGDDTSKILTNLSADLMGLAKHELGLQRKISNSEELARVVADNSHLLPKRKTTLTADELCAKPQACVPQFQPLIADLRYTTDYPLVACPIEKNMSTLLKAMLCYLNRRNEFVQNGRHLINEWNEVQFCSPFENAVLISGKGSRRFADVRERFHNSTFFAIIRDPIERVLSGFVDKCIRKPYGPVPCNGCHYNLTCFLETELARTRFQVHHNNFRRTYEDLHFLPQNWYCYFGEHWPLYRIVQYSSEPEKLGQVLEQLFGVFRGAGVGAQEIDFIEQQMKEGRTLHSTVQSPMRRFLRDRITNSSYLLELIVRIYYHDFRLFGFPLPKLD